MKKGNYFRVYDIEKYDGKVYYWMSGGYRVQSTNLVVFKEVPMNLRVSFFDNYALIVSTREGIGNIHKEYGAILKNVIPSKSKADVGKEYDYNHGGAGNYLFEKYTFINGKLEAEIDFAWGYEGMAYYVKEFVSGSYIKVLEKQSFPSGYYIATQNTKTYQFPLLTSKQLFKVEQNTLILVAENP